MDRRDFLKSTGAAAAAATAVSSAATVTATSSLAAPAAVKGLQEFRLAMPWQEGCAGPADWARRLGQNIAAMSNGRYRIVLEFGVADGLAGVREGAADLYFGGAHNLAQAPRGLAYFAGLPGDRGVSPQHLQTWISVGGGQALWDDLGGDIGIKPLLAAHTGAHSYLLAAERIETMSALAGRKAQVHGLARDVARGLGLDPVSLPPGQLADAMQRGEVLAAECGGAIVSYALGLPSVAPYSAGASINRHGTALFLGIRRSLWNSLGVDEQAMFTAAAAGEFQLSLAEEDAHRLLLHPEAPAERTWPLAGELAHAIRRVADAVVAHTAGSDPQTRRISDSFAAFRRAAVGGDAALA
ncbi:MAG: twin-arginine translocation signal domain-containing protein [Hyphomicrobium sp.]|nr:twin-arginine translocation signal domain-containing protein [Hyphomicrobium sp.]